MNWTPATSTTKASILGAALLAASVSLNAADNEVSAARSQMIAVIERYAKTVVQTPGGHIDPDILSALGSVRRHHFVPDKQKSFAYDDRPLPIGHGQTISQPFIVALMTDLIEPKKDHVVLEIGTGSGYQAAVLAKLVKQVFTIEIIKPLKQQATARLQHLGYDNVTTRLGDGYYGWEEHGPFDSIVVTAAASHVPPPLISQLRPGGRMVIPVGGRFMTQQLLLIEKDQQGKIFSRQILPVRFVPLTGER